MKISKILSGTEQGAEEAALEAAMNNRIEFSIIGLPGIDRILHGVSESDATLIIANRVTPELHHTVLMCHVLRKPCFVAGINTDINEIINWLDDIGEELIINVTGPPSGHKMTFEIIDTLLN